MDMPACQSYTGPRFNKPPFTHGSRNSKNIFRMPPAPFLRSSFSSDCSDKSELGRSMNTILQPLTLFQLRSHVSTPTASEPASPPQSSLVLGNAVRWNRTLTFKGNIPNLAKSTAKLRARLQLFQLSTVLTHCQTVQAITDKLQHQPLAETPENSLQDYFIKMGYLASRAQRLAQALQSQEHEARCEYWAGRASGGARDYKRAMAHFDRAMELDIYSCGSRREETPPRGLTWREKDDVRFLLESVTRRYESRKKRTRNTPDQIIADYEAERTGRPVEDCLKTIPDSPVWAPDRERLVQKARRGFKAPSREIRGSDVECLENGPTQDSKTDMDHNEDIRRPFSEEEWWYIKYGHDMPSGRKTRNTKAERTSRPMSRQSSGASTPDLTSGSSAESESGEDDACSPLLARACSLRQELEAAMGRDGDGTSIPEASTFEANEGDGENLIPTGQKREVADER